MVVGLTYTGIAEVKAAAPVFRKRFEMIIRAQNWFKSWDIYSFKKRREYLPSKGAKSA
jgi:hypothetical protein